MKRHSNILRQLTLGVLGLFAAGSTALAQTSGSSFPPALNTEQNPLRNVSAGALAGRSPGNLVSAGVARTLAAADFGRSIIEITEEPPGPDPKATLLADAIKTVFDQLNQALLLFENVLRIRAGLPPRVPIDIPGVDTGDLTGTDSKTDVSSLLDGA